MNKLFTCLMVLNALNVYCLVDILVSEHLTQHPTKIKAAKTDLNFLKQPENRTLLAGKRLLLRCKPNLSKYIKNLNEKTTKLVEYQWFKDNLPIIYKAKTNLYKDGSLEITQVSEEDTGSYNCIAKYRSLVYESQKAYVNVNRISSTTSMSKQTFGTSKSLPRFLIWPEDRSIAEEDEVIFECLAMNDASLFSGFGNNLSLNNLQFYKYKWLKDGVALDIAQGSKDKRFKLVQGVNLRIEKLKESDSGTYTCRICNTNQKSLLLDKDFIYDNKNSDSSNLNNEKEECDERSSSLRVLVSPRFIKRPSNLNVTLKSDAELECSAHGVPSPIIQWFKNGEPIYPSDYFQFNANEGNLKILGIISQDEGYYQCLATNELNTIQSVAQLNVQSEDYQSDDYQETSKKLTTITTTKNAIILNKNNLNGLTTPSSIVHLSAPISLRVVKSKSKSLQLEWQRPAIVRNIPLSNSDQNSASTLYYAINWKPKNMDRKREINTTETSILIDDLTAETVYLINVCAIMASKKGPYSFLEAKTDADMQIPSAPIDFKYELITESNLDELSSEMTSQKIRFKWKRPLINGDKVLKYRLYYQHLNYGLKGQASQAQEQSENGESYQFFPSFKEEDYDTFMEEDAFNPKSEKKSTEKHLDIDLESVLGDEEYFFDFSLDELSKYSTYRFRLVALDSRLIKTETDSVSGEDNNGNSAELLFETPSDVPDGPPENLQVETLNTTSILVQWSMPLVDKRNGLIVGYKIAVKENNKEVWDSNVDSEPRRKLISGLLPGHKYSVRITARTVNGSGPASDWFIAETFLHEMDESKVPGQPLALFTEPTDKSIVIHWTPPSSNSTLIRKYLLRYGTSPTNEIYVELPVNRNSYIINNLVPSSQYILSLKAGNNAGFGKEILKDVITKRKFALGENENLFPPLNVHATSLSPESIQIDWTDWHLKPDEEIPDDRYYLIRYNIEKSNAKYQFRNASERNLILTDLRPNTLYDFSVRLVIGRRESDWSMTTSQMTMELSPAPRNISIRIDPSNPINLILSWLAPSQSSSKNVINGYVISYTDESTFKENQNNKWKYEHVNSNSSSFLQQHTIRKLKPETVYYFKIQARNNRAYGASSATIKFKTPNAKGEGGGKIFIPHDQQNSNLDVVLNSGEIFASTTSQLKNKEKWILGGIGMAFIALFIIIFSLFKSKKSKKDKNDSPNKSKSLKRNSGPKENRSTNMGGDDIDDVESIYQKSNHLQQQQQVLICNSNPNKMNNELNMQSNLNHNLSGASTLLKQQHHSYSQRTPSHHHQPLVINNPNHMMLNLMNPLSINNNTNNSSQNHTSLTDCEFYSNVSNPPAFTNNSHTLSEAGFYSNNINNNNNNPNLIDSFPNPHSFNQNNNFYSHNIDNDDFSNEAALAAANAAFNSPFLNNNTSNQALLNNNSSINNEPSFLRQTIRPKPIAIPLNATSNVNSNGSEYHTSGMFTVNSTHRKSFKNLPIATATLISSNNNNGAFNNSQQNPSNFFNDLNLKQQQQTQKLHYTARPYIIDNQVQANNGDYSNTSNNSNHSPASSCHSSGQPQVYDKIGNVPINVNNTKSLLQPLKSFSTNPNNIQSSSLSIPNTPAKYCENFGNMRSPAKKQLLVSLANNTTSTGISRVNNYGSTNKSSDILTMMGKSMENVYDRKLNGVENTEELTAEMANLEGIMKDLSAITATQFEC